jgi:CubicO group peptidase (beta-lactamase class C family)
MPDRSDGLSRRRFLQATASAAGLVVAAPAIAAAGIATRTGAPIPSWSRPDRPSPLQEPLDAFVTSRMEIARFPGLGAATLRDGDVRWSHGWGLANVEDATPATRETVFMLASVSKTVVCCAVMQAVERGLFGLDDDIDGILPFPIHSPNFPTDVITPRMLLTHTSGLRDNWGALIPLYVDGDSPIPLATFVEGYFVAGGAWYDAARNFQTWKPGTRYVYSNMGATTAAFLVEAASGVAFDQWCEDNIFAPLGMDQTSWHLAGLDPANVAMPYRYQRSSDSYLPFGQYGYPDYPDGQLRTSPRQLARFVAAICNGGQTADGVRILEQATVDEILRNQLAGLISWKQGLIWYGSGNAATGPLWGHNGGDSGVATYAFFSPSKGTGVVLTANGSWRGATEGHAYRQIRDRLLAEAESN